MSLIKFLSPFYNRRKDGWGGSDKGRFRFLAETSHRSAKPCRMICPCS
ncbi:MAG: hypothetical protein C4519_03985 [Desulfobacteraceae bacterium]|nr:MAG: hypothetical protein C4519_03985 [Desulfobacteraceae bacterium]